MENSTTTTRKATEQEVEVCEYLNELRESGETNMYGARPYVENRFGIDRTEAGRLVTLWMTNFNDEGNYETVKL